MRKGVKSWLLILPMILMTFILQIGLIINASVISTLSNMLSQTMTDSAENVSDISTLQSRFSLLSETATSFIIKPYNDETGTVNEAPLLGYASELAQSSRDPDAVLARIKARGVQDDVYEYASIAATKVKEMMQIQYHAIALTRSVYPTNNRQLDAIPDYVLSEEEKALSDQDKLEKALSLLWDTDYSIRKRDISSNASQAMSLVKSRASVRQIELNNRLNLNKVFNWVFTVLIVLTLFSFFFVVIKYIIIPIVKYTRNIEEDEKLPVMGLYETRVLARSYNELVEKKKIYEKDLVNSVETDALTGLKSRYALNSIFQQEVGPTSIALFVFDVNNLKVINDDQGHDAGDELIQRASNCIMKTFNFNDSFLAYRFGGDEFVAIIKNITKADIDNLMAEFATAQKDYEVSIACGYEYEEDGSNTSYSQLFKRADRNMYDDKRNSK
ncbi:MAG: GGDEF domain-containing protein [Acholeplasmatales bacterium]|nr:GGDEF domain-containing protein [Acholeplasmatales bacterium]